nr:bifunctional hydroxymethylpyrimidine kinase/phosphomethylpyrimidine kinase [Pseudodesulfovibrio sp. JC047]
MTIAGSDSGGGAGIQADLKTISMLCGYGASVITALTAQNTHAVGDISAPSPDFVALQLSMVLEDIQVDAAKTGMLFSAPIIKAIAPLLTGRTFPLVVDPVCVSTSGAKLLEDDAVSAMVELVFPLADMITPNLPETALFTGISIESREDIFKAADILLAMGPKSVLIKGGHADSLAVTDWFFTADSEPVPLMQARVDTECTHGTGCTLSAAIATGLAHGLDPVAAIAQAQKYLNLALRAGTRIGAGGGPPNHLAPWLQERSRQNVMAQVDTFARKIVAMDGAQQLFSRSVSNVAVALPFAENRDDVCGLSGGFFSSVRGVVSAVGYPEFGVSVRTASVLLAARRVRAQTGCAVALNGQPKLVAALDDIGVEIEWFEPARKPEYVNVENGQLEEWGAFEVLKEYDGPETVDGVGDPGGEGRVPTIYLWAVNVDDLVTLVRKIVEFMAFDPKDS